MAGKRLDRKRCDAAWQAYSARGSVADMRRVTGMGYATARRLCEEGAPEHDIPSFKVRYATAQRTAAEQVAAQAAQDAGGALRVLRENLSRLNEMTSRLADKALASVQAPAFRVKDPASALRSIATALKTSVELEAMLALIARPADGADARTDATVLFNGWTSEELLRYAETGVWPAGKRPAEGKPKGPSS
jgi:hypothetical protein